MRLTLILFIVLQASCITTQKPKEPSIVRLLSKDKRFMCSGTVVNSAAVLTADHCLDAAYIQSDSNRNIVVPILRKFGNPRLDIAIVIADVVQFASEDVEIAPGEIWGASYKRACGFPMGGEMYCVNFKRTNRKYFQFQCEVDAYPGMSGGPIFARWTGKVIGVVSAVDEQGELLWSPTTELWNTVGVSHE